MNTFGNIFRVSVLGASHEKLVGVTIDGVPSGLPLAAADFTEDMHRRQGGNGRGTTPRKETDIPRLESGIFNGYTTGAPLLITFLNENTRSEDYQKQRSFPRPSHADMVAHQKFGGFEDFRGGGTFSARLTAGVVAAGVIAKKLLPNIHIQAEVIEAGGEKDIEKGLARAIEAKDSIGGIIECRASGIPPGLGAPFWDSAESLLAHAAFSIPAVKGVEFGSGFAAARMSGTEHNDPILDAAGRTRTNHAGGIVGGITNGNELVYRIAVKPTASTPRPQETYNWETGTMGTLAVRGRHDLCVALRAPVILEAMTAIVLTDLMMAEQKIPNIITGK